MWRAPLRLPTPSSPLLPALEPAGGGGRWAINWYSLYFCGGCWRRRRTRHDEDAPVAMTENDLMTICSGFVRGRMGQTAAGGAAGGGQASRRPVMLHSIFDAEWYLADAKRVYRM